MNTPPHSPRSATLHLVTKVQNASAIASPHYGSPTSPNLSDLSARCRALAQSISSSAKEDFFHSDDAQSPRLAPASPSASFLSPLSPRALGPPTPDGSYFSLEEIEEEPQETDGVGGKRDEEDVLDGALRNGGPDEIVPAAGTDEDVSDFESSSAFSRGRQASSHSSFGSHIGLRSPVRSAIYQGAMSVVVDVWLVDGELLAGPEVTSSEDTLTSLYLDPLLHLFQPPESPSSPARSHRRRSSANALFHITHDHPFHLIVSLKNDPAVTFQYLLHALAPLHDASLLTYFCPKSNFTTPGLITVVCTGAVPLGDIQSLSPRYVFGELPLEALLKEGHALKEVTPVTSGSLQELTGWDGSNTATEEQTKTIAKHVALAHDNGLDIRYFDLPKWPSHTHELVKSTLNSLGVDLL